VNALGLRISWAGPVMFGPALVSLDRAYRMPSFWSATLANALV
jgi:hypothetical protein